MTTELVPQSAATLAPIPTDDEINRLYRIAEGVALSKLGKSSANVGAAYYFTKMLIGRELGLSPGMAISGSLHIFDGNVQMAATSLGASIRLRGYKYKVTEHTDQKCCIKFFDNDVEHTELGDSEFTWENAKTAGLINKDNWKKNPRNMLWARAMSNGVKWYIPEALGGLPVYTEGDDLEEVTRVQNLAQGHGDGSDPGWGTVPPDLATAVERRFKRAEKVNFKGLGTLSTLKLTLNHAEPPVIQNWIKMADELLDKQDKSEEEPVDATVVEE